MEQQRTAANVVTSENLGEFIASRQPPDPQAVAVIDDAASKAAAEAKKTDDQKAADAAVKAKQGAEPTDAELEKNPLKDRFHDLTQKRKDAEALAATEAAGRKAAQERADSAERAAAELRAKYEPPKSDELGPEPLPEQFQDLAEYRKAITDWAGERALREKSQADAEASAKTQAEATTRVFNERLAAAKAKTPDFDARIAASTVQFSDQAKDAIIASDNPGELLLYFADNPAEADRLRPLSVAQMQREMIKIDVKLGQPAAKAVAELKIVPVSKAPAPIEPLRGGAQVDVIPLDSKGEFIGTYAQYKQLRKEGKLH